MHSSPPLTSVELTGCSFLSQVPRPSTSSTLTARPSASLPTSSRRSTKASRCVRAQVALRQGVPPPLAHSLTDASCPRLPHQVTAITGDAADSSLIESLCTRAAKEHGRLDYFYANAGITGANMHLPTMDEEGIMEVMRVNLLRCVAG